jgi:hypothetical protein
MTRVALIAIIGLASLGCARQQSESQSQVLIATDVVQAGPNTLTAGERAAGWRLLFDGATTQGWRTYGKPGITGWQVVDGALTRTGPGGDIITTDKYRNFELIADWKIAEGGNSGIFYRAVETADPIYYSAPEMQVLDDAKHNDGRSEMTSAGSNFALYPARRGVVKPAGQWNTARLVVNGNHVEHWLNDVKLVEYELGSPEWKERVAKSKFNAWPAYGKAAEGYIGLQEHGDWVAFRNIRVRRLP